MGKIGLPLILLFYLVLVIVTFNRTRLPNLVNHLAPSIPLAFLAILTVITWRAAFYAPDGLLHATILDVGTGDAVLIQTPEGRSVLINGGPSTIRLSDSLGR